MLRRLKIGARVNLLIAVPLLALLALTVVSYVSLDRASVRGDEYKELKTAEGLRSAIVPPKANLLRAWAAVNQLAVLVASPPSDLIDVEIVDTTADLKEARADYDAAVAEWRARPLDDTIMSAFERSATAGEAFFVKVDSKLIPAVDARDPARSLDAVDSLGDSYAVQKSLIARALDLVEKQVHSKEASTDKFVGTVTGLLAAAVGALLLIVATTAFFVRRSIVRPIHALSSQARKVAETDLPAAVHQIQSQAADAPMPTVEPFSTGTHDELAELSASFNSVQGAALELAAEQASAHRAVADNLVNIARRTQSLPGRSLTSLADMEQAERDPETLENLFHLDHLSTRMRRNARSLLVLAGADQNRLWSAPLPMGDAVRTAFSEIENYARVELGDVNVASVQGALAPDIAHLLAELLENATTFSPPSSPVMVVGRSLADGHQLAIIDYGIGMSLNELEEANVALHRQVDFAQTSSRMLGFQVVARIAARLNINVVLAQTAGATGVTAIVKLPSSVLEFRPAERAEEGTRDAASDSRQDLPAPLPVEPVSVAAAPAAFEAELASGGATGLDDAPFLTGSDLVVRPIQSAPSFQQIVLPPPTRPATYIDFGEPVFGLPADPAVSAPEIAPATTPAAVVTPAAAPSVATLPKRVRGAQLPDSGQAMDANQSFERPAEHVRSALSSLQRGTDLGRNNHE